jgi:hypothetical protein
MGGLMKNIMVKIMLTLKNPITSDLTSNPNSRSPKSKVNPEPEWLCSSAFIDVGAGLCPPRRLPSTIVPHPCTAQIPLLLYTQFFYRHND